MIKILNKHFDNIFYYLTITFLAVFLCGVWAPHAYSEDRIDPFKGLRKRLIRDGFSPERIEILFQEDKVSFELKGVTQFFMHNEAKLNYKHFTEKYKIDHAKQYMKSHQETLAAAENKYGVDAKIITAIMLVETRLGKYTGNKKVIDTLATIAVLSESGSREILWDNIPKDKRYARAKFDKKADWRSKWAYNELKAFLTYTEEQSIDPLSIKGSYAGAMGFAQFTPSNIIKLGQDGDKDGRINLFEHPDAINSIANYLKYHGWRPGISRQKAKKVIYSYNHSKYYVNIILDIAYLLRG